MPDNAKSVYKGQRFEVFQQDQELYDGTQKIFERVKGKDSNQIIAVTEDKKIIFQEEFQPQRSDMFTSFPGGMTEENEEPLISAKRELLEETGFESNDFEFLFKFRASGIFRFEHIFIAKNCRKISEQKLDPGEKITVKLISYDEMIVEILKDNFRNQTLAYKLLQIHLDKNREEEFKTRLGL